MDRREVASAARAELGCLAGIVGGLLLVVAFLLLVVAVNFLDQGPYGLVAACAVIVGIGFLGAALCYVSWRLFFKSN